MLLAIICFLFRTTFQIDSIDLYENLNLIFLICFKFKNFIEHNTLPSDCPVFSLHDFILLIHVITVIGLFLVKLVLVIIKRSTKTRCDYCLSAVKISKARSNIILLKDILQIIIYYHLIYRRVNQFKLNEDFFQSFNEKVDIRANVVYEDDQQIVPLNNKKFRYKYLDFLRVNF